VEPVASTDLLRERGAGGKVAPAPPIGVPQDGHSPPGKPPPANGARRRIGLIRRLVVGRARPTAHMEHTLLPKFLALPVFSSDALSSVAYATEEALLVLVMVSISARTLVLPIAIVISLLMVMVVASYRQTVRAYPTAAGSYVVSKDNLGVPAGLVAAAALLADYVLTVSVSVVAGVVAITSAVPALDPYKVEISLAAVAVIAVANLRGVRESGFLVALPAYGFILSVFAMLLVGGLRCVGGCPRAYVPNPVPVGPPLAAVGLMVILHAFASGSTALTGVEAISNGVSAFRRPQWRNAQETLTIMGAIAVTMFLGVTVLAVGMHALPSTSVSVISEIARAAFPGPTRGSGGPMFYVVQAFTFAILIFAANTSFQDFPRLSAILARDRFLPRQFENRGDRLVFSNGVIVLTVFSCLLILIFRASVDALIQLYVVGVFTAFTLSQTGMVRHWFRAARKGGPQAAGWRHRALINGIGAVATGVVTLIVIRTKFMHGAWIVIVAVPLMMTGFYAVRRHYARVGEKLHRGAVSVQARPRTSAVLYVPDVGPATGRALGYVRAFSDDFRAVHVANGHDADLRERWDALTRGSVPLDVVRAHGRPAEALVEYLRAMPATDRDFLGVIVPETFTRPSMVAALRAPTFPMKLRLLSEPGVVITDVPVLSPPDAPEPVRATIPHRREVLVMIAGVSDASVQAINYATSLQPDGLRAVYFAFDPAEVEPIWNEWLDRRIPVELDLVDAPFRDLGPPVLREIREATARQGTVVNVIIPELVVANRRHEFLHNQRALFIKRLLLFEPGVILTSVPYRLDDARGE